MADKSPLQIMTEAGMTPDMIRALDPLRRAYGWAASFNDVPELKKILDQAVAEKWSDDVLVAAIQNSQWARSKDQRRVQYEIDARLHPADVARKRQDLKVQIQEIAVKLGMEISPERLNTMSGWALKNGYSDGEVQRMVTSEFHYDPKANQGLAEGGGATTLDALKKQAGDFMVPVSDAALGMWVDAIIRGTEDPASFEEWLRNQAKSLYSPLAGEIDRGLTPRALLDPYKNVLEQELNIADVDMADPKYGGALFHVDPKTGLKTMKNLDEWQTEVRKNPKYGWDRTIRAQNMSAELGDRLLVELGQVAH